MLFLDAVKAWTFKPSMSAKHSQPRLTQGSLFQIKVKHADVDDKLMNFFS